MSFIGDKYAFPNGQENSVTSVAHFWFGAVALKSLLSSFLAIFPTVPL